MTDSKTLLPRARPGIVAAAMGALVLVLALLPTAASGQEGDGVTPARVAGDDRYATAAEIARLTFDDAAIAHVVSGEDFPDALAASYAGGRAAGPILLVDQIDVPDATWDALADLGVETTVIVGGTAAVSETVEAQLAAAGYQTDRIFGVDRYQTASAVAMRYGSDGGVGTLDGERTALLASGTSYPDALAAGPIAASAAYPLFLTPPDRTEVSVNTSLDQLDIGRILVIGGTAAVSEAVENHYRDRGYIVERIAGPTRTHTARAVAELAQDRLGWSVELSLLARGDGFADALTGSVHGGVTVSPILLTESPSTLSAATRGWFQGACPDVDAVRALGGTAAVSQSALSDAVASAESCMDRSDAEQDFLVAPQEVVTLEPGESLELRVSQRFDDEAFSGPVDVALFACRTVGATESPVPFADADADGHADGTGTSDTGAALITTENGQPVGATVVRDVGPAEDGILRIVVQSDADDCTVPVVWDDIDGDGNLDVDADGFATEPFGVGQVAWA